MTGLMRKTNLSAGIYIKSLMLILLLTLPPHVSTHAQELLHPVPGTPLARDFELPDLDGNKLKLSDFKGHVVIVNFWATWCPPCRAEIPSMQRAWNVLKNHNVVLLAIHVGGNEDKIWSFLTDFNVDFPVSDRREIKGLSSLADDGPPHNFHY